MSLIRLHLGPNKVDFVPRILFLPIFQIITKYPLLPLFQNLSICVTLWRQWQKQSYPFPSVIVCLPVMSCVSRIQDLRLENPTRSLLDHTAVEVLNVITFGPKCNKVLNVISLQCNRLTPSVHCCYGGHPHWDVSDSCCTKNRWPVYMSHYGLADINQRLFTC